MKKNRKFFENRIGGSFHYENKFMDLYAWKIRTLAFFKNVEVFGRRIVDVGCGDGSWGHEFIKRNAEEVIGIEQSLKLAQGSKIRTYFMDMTEKFHYKQELWHHFDIVTAITSLNFTLPKKRMMVLTNIRALLRDFGNLIVIDYLPNIVPPYQKNKDYKEIWCYDQWLRFFNNNGFRLVKTVPINWIDTSLFHFLGKKRLVYYLTLFLDRFFTRFNEPKYRLLILKKIQ